MATVAVAAPVVPGPFSKSAQIALQLMAPAPPGIAPGDPETLSGRFVLNSRAFVDLQIYLKAGLMLPADKNAYEAAFPSSSFEPWFKKDQKGGLHEKTLTTLTNIFQHCYRFQNITVDKMMIFATKLSKFSETEDVRVKEIQDQKPVIADDKLDLSSPQLKAAIGKVWSACLSLIADGDAAEKEALGLVADLRKFQTDTENDEKDIKDVSSRTLAVLPTMDDIGRSAAEEYTRLRAQLKQLYDDQVNESRNNGWPNSGALTYVNSIGVVMYCKDQAMFNRMMEIDKKLTGLWDGAQSSYVKGVQLSAKTENMKTMVKQVTETIGKAIQALKDIGTAFRTFTTELAGIQTKIKSMNPSLNLDMGWLRVLAYDDFDLARAGWVEVKNAAEFFGRHGVLLRNNDKQKLIEIQQPPVKIDEGLNILGATFGNTNVTKLARALYSRGSTIAVPGVVRDFSDTWMKVEKTYTMLYAVDKGYRVFCSKEYGESESFTYTLRRDFGASSIGSAHHSLSPVKGAPPNSPIEIIAIFWGPAKRDDTKVVDYVYGCVNNTPGIVWSNANFGGDSWSGMKKTGTIYYRLKGKTEVLVLSGREDTNSQLDASS